MQRAFLSSSPLRRLPSTVRHQSTISTAEAASPSLSQRVKGTVWSTEGIVVASVGFGMYFAYFVSRWQPLGRQMPTSAHYEYKFAEAMQGEGKVIKTSEDISNFKAKTDAVFKNFKP
jgi:hypothetical protein